jgi:hypothetical protein
VRDAAPCAVDYVTGAALAIPRAAFADVGAFDEGFYPAYYEEADYCFRTRRHGRDVIYVPAARIRHLRSSGEALRDPAKHAANQHRQRYRFVSKHWDLEEMRAFFSAEREAIARDDALYQAVGRVLAARRTCVDLPRILESRERDLGAPASPIHGRLLATEFADLVPRAFERAEHLVQALPRDVVRSAGVTLPPDRAANGALARLSAALAEVTGEAQAHEALERRAALLATLARHEFPA